jgi:hypothetical protein
VKNKKYKNECRRQGKPKEGKERASWQPFSVDLSIFVVIDSDAFVLLNFIKSGEFMKRESQRTKGRRGENRLL